jgi:hypothetical protein
MSQRQFFATLFVMLLEEVLLQDEGSKDPFLITSLIIQSKLSSKISDSKKDTQGVGAEKCQRSVTYYLNDP